MSWDASLVAACCGTSMGRDFCYTNNTTSMVCAAARAVGVEFEGFQATLDGMDGCAGRDLLRRLAHELHDHPSTYDAMNPENGWGSREGIMAEMLTMAAAVPESPPTIWRVT